MIPKEHQLQHSLTTQVLFTLFLGIILFLTGLLRFTLGLQVWYSGRIYPGVTVSGIDVGGLRVSEAADKISQHIKYPEQGKLLLRHEGQSWVLSPSEVGLYLDPESSARNAYAIGRQGRLNRLDAQFDAWHYGHDVPVNLVFDQRMAFQYLSSLRQHIDRPVVEAQISLQGTEVIVRSSQNGQELDIPANLGVISSQLNSLQDGMIELLVQQTPAVVIDVNEQAELTRRILSQSLTLSMPEDQPDQKGPWIFEPPALAAMLNLEKVQGSAPEHYQVTLDSDMLRAFLADQKDPLHREPQNARLKFNEETADLEVIQPAVTGQDLNIENSIKTIQQEIVKGNHTIYLDIELSPPLITDDTTSQELGITELVSSETSYFYGSSAPRIHNIATAASRFNGLMVPPRTTFSMADALGDISLNTGYAEALIIYGDQTIEGVGGGVCQVSTTLFRTVFFGGYPIVERHPHAYRVVYYEKNERNQTDPDLIGLDATVYVPVVDFKFTNDTDYWILMETIVDEPARLITWKFYSTSDGRSVDWETSGPTNIVPEPEALYTENPELEEGEIEQVDWGVDGADITVERTVYKENDIYLEDTFQTHYKPWRDIYEYGPGTEGIPTPSPDAPDTET